MGKGGNSKKKESGGPKKRTKNDYVAPEDMDDEIDAFHKQRDVIPLDINGDIEDSEEDTEERVFDIEGIDDDEDDDDDDMDDETQLTGLAAKISKQQKYLRAKTGGVEDEMHDDADEDEERKPDTWGRGKNIYYSADNIDYELQSSDEELAAEEEAEVLRLQREKAKSYSMEDFGLEDEDHDDGDEEPTLGEIMIKGKAAPKPLTEKEGEDGTDIMYEEVKKDINALSREEQMDVVYSAAPELVGLLSELNVALEELESRVNPLLSMDLDTGREIGRGRAEGGLYILDLDPKPSAHQSSSVPVASDIQRWHERLGHPFAASLQRLFSVFSSVLKTFH